MADMAGAMMRGFSFVNNVQQQGRENKRQDALMARQGLMWDREDELYNKAKSEEAGRKEGYSKLIMAMAQKDQAWKQIADNPAATEKMVTLAEDPLSAAKAINQWDDIGAALNSGKMPDRQAVLAYLNNPNVSGRDLEKRFAANKLKGFLSDIHPTPDRKGLFFEATLTRPDGSQYLAPLTVGKTVHGVPGSDQDQVQPFAIDKLLDHGHGAADAQYAALTLLAEKGGTAGAEFAAKFIMEKDKAKREALIKEFEYQRERGDKVADRKQDRQWDVEDAATKHKYAMQEKTPPGYDLVKGEDGEIYTMNKATGDVKPYGGGTLSPAAGGLKGFVTTSTGQVFRNKEAKELFKSLPNTFLAKASADELMTKFSQSGDDPAGMPIEAKKSIVAAAEEVAANPNATERERSTAKLWLDIGEGLGVFPKQGNMPPAPRIEQYPEPNPGFTKWTSNSAETVMLVENDLKRGASRENIIDGLIAIGWDANDVKDIMRRAESGKSKSGLAGGNLGVDPNKFAAELEQIKDGKQAISAPQTDTSPAQQAKGGIARTIGRTLAGPGGPQSDSMGLREVAQGLSAGAAMATPAMVNAIQGIPEGTKEALKVRMVKEKWTDKELYQIVREIQAGYQEQSAINQRDK